MSYFEKPSLFYLGKIRDPLTNKLTDDLLYESKNLTTHALCVGMTGSGKTGLGVVFLEEAGIDKIPALIIDPKGDLSNLLLTFPNLSPQEFKPWIDLTEAERKGISPIEYSKFIAKTWKDGLEAWGEDGERIKKFKNTADVVVYTPANKAGIPISILKSFTAPSKEEIDDIQILREKILSLTSSLLGLLGIDADPVKSRELILISTIIQHAWQSGKNIDIPTLIQQIQNPPFSIVGALDTDTFYPVKDRIALSVQLNNLLASPGFQVWMEGVPLDIGELLYSKEGKPKLSVISIAHLSDTERMFFVTLLLNEFVSWMRLQTGTSSLRAILYMDEIFGFFPPVATPPSKLPMMTLLKQSRAFGIGVILATQNPVDLDYKGLSNCGTWFIGKLQTNRDKARVLEGLKIASNGELNSQELDQMIALTGKRIFIMRSIYEKKPILFETRWTLSYLKGPLTLKEIATFKEHFKEYVEEGSTQFQEKIIDPRLDSKPNLSPDINEYFVNRDSLQKSIQYEPRLAGFAKIHFVNSKHNIDAWEEINIVLPIAGNDVDWENGENIPELKKWISKEPLMNNQFAQLPEQFSQEKNYSNFAKQLATTLYQNQVYTVYQTFEPNMISKQGESEKDFRIRVAFNFREKRDELIKKLREKYTEKMTILNDKIQRAQAKAEQKKQSALWQKIQTWISFLFTIISALFNRKLTQGTINQTGTSIRKATKITKNSQDAILADEEISNYQKQLDDLETQMNQEIATLNSQCESENISIDQFTIRPRKSDIIIEKIALIWWA
ncbi:MAG: ATP-binding protein [Parachlamydiaceae bacterium]|nr:ATP-binding protein [Parachlamydiaceae bacterium]